MPVAEASNQANRVSAKDLTTSLDRALAILDLISERRGGVTNAELARQLGIPSSSCCYVLQRLERAGYLTRYEDSRRYELGIKVLGFAHRVLCETRLPAIAEPVLQEIARVTGQVVIVAILHKGRTTILRRSGLPDLADVDFEMGASFPAHATAVGKMLLARLPERSLQEFLDSEKLVKRSPTTINSKAELVSHLQVIRRRGHSTSDGELYTRIKGLAVPIVDDSGQTCAGLTIAGPRLRLDDDRAIRALHDGAVLISKRLQQRIAAGTRSSTSPIAVLTALQSSH